MGSSARTATSHVTFVWNDHRLLGQYPNAVLIVTPGPELASRRGSAAPYMLDVDGRELRWVDHINPGELDRNLTADEEENE